jgi:hypothetical protein
MTRLEADLQKVYSRIHETQIEIASLQEQLAIAQDRMTRLRGTRQVLIGLKDRHEAVAAKYAGKRTPA